MCQHPSLCSSAICLTNRSIFATDNTPAPSVKELDPTFTTARCRRLAPILIALRLNLFVVLESTECLFSSCSSSARFP
ncbi:UDP-N-acetylmuramyl-tripeptide synthetase [Alicyclobacillus hesperidum URH17-3-68]|nr:UDP-N-acetylmuramyl-tripeptide synthetase [Alicyclobacillus hesperidum URH17-3-68]